MSADRLEQLLARHRVVAADLAAIIARADQRRAAGADLRAETEALLGELRQVVGRTADLQRVSVGRQGAIDRG